MLPQCQCGDVIILANMPFWAASLIDPLQDGQPYHHCGIVLPDARLRPCVWEAIPPRVHYLWVPEYGKQIDEWSGNWRYRLGRKPLVVEVWRLPGITEEQIDFGFFEALRWLGTKYRLVLNYAWDGASVHCSEFVSRVLVAAKLLTDSDFLDNKQRSKPPSRRTPWDLRQAIERNGWHLIPETVASVGETG